MGPPRTGYLPKKELLWQFRPEKHLEIEIPMDRCDEFRNWIYQQHLEMDGKQLIVAGVALEIRGGRDSITYKVFCPTRAFKTMLKLAWGGANR